jgi:hypothetical protein
MLSEVMNHASEPSEHPRVPVKSLYSITVPDVHGCPAIGAAVATHVIANNPASSRFMIPSNSGSFGCNHTDTSRPDCIPPCSFTYVGLKYRLSVYKRPVHKLHQESEIF